MRSRQNLDFFLKFATFNGLRDPFEPSFVHGTDFAFPDQQSATVSSHEGSHSPLWPEEIGQETKWEQGFSPVYRGE